MKKTIIGFVAVISLLGAASFVHADTISLYSVADAEITGNVAGSYVNTHNWGTLEYLTGNINKTGGPTSAQFPNTGDSRGLFQFDLSSIPAGATIDSAIVSIYIGFNAFTPITSRLTSVSLYQVTSSWTETGVTYDTRPTWNIAPSTTMSIPAPTGTVIKTPFNGYISGDITSLVQGWLDGDILNAGLATSDTYTANGLLRIYAHEAGGSATNTDPRLIVTYTEADIPEPATMSLLAVGGLAISFRRKARNI